MRWITVFCIALFTSTLLIANDACSYLTNEEVERVTGRKLLFKLTSMPLPNGAGTLCDSNIVRVIVLTGENSEQILEKMIKEFGREGEQRIPISDLGEHAYVLHLKPRTEHERPSVLVTVKARSNTAAISVRAREDGAPEAAQPQAVELAKIVTSKLH